MSGRTTKEEVFGDARTRAKRPRGSEPEVTHGPLETKYRVKLEWLTDPAGMGQLELILKTMAEYGEVTEQDVDTVKKRDAKRRPDRDA